MQHVRGGRLLDPGLCLITYSTVQPGASNNCTGIAWHLALPACCRNSVAQLFRVATPLLAPCLLACTLPQLMSRTPAQNPPPALWQMSQQPISHRARTECVQCAMSVTQDNCVEKYDLFSQDFFIPIDITLRIISS